MKRILIYSAYALSNSRYYTKSKGFCYNLLKNPRSRLKSYFDLFMIGLVMLSVFLLVYEVHEELGQLGDIFEQFVVTIFIIEYLMRGWLCSDSHKLIITYHEKSNYLNTPFRLREIVSQIVIKKLKYIFSVVAIIDLLAILPSYRPLRFLRVLLIFRLFKLFRYSNSIKLFVDVLNSKRFELITLLIFMGFLVFIASIGLYLFENEKSGGQVQYLHDAFYWAIVTISTVGYGDITPQTIGGRLVAIALIISGLGALAFFTSIIVAAFNDKMHTLRENRNYAELDRYDEFVIICGFGRVGQEIAKQLKQDETDFIVIDRNLANIQRANYDNILAIHDDASKNEVLLNAGIHRGAIAILCTTGNDVSNVYITLSGRYLNADIRIISRANDSKNIKKLKQAGANHVIQPFETAGLLAAEYLGQPVAFEVVLDILQGHKYIQMDTLIVYEHSFIEGMSLKAIDFEPRKLRLVGVISLNNTERIPHNRYEIKNQHFFFNPKKNFICKKNDILVVLGRDLSIDYFREQIEKSC
ncbi:MAG: NAD-binding protein [Methylococcales bacterium]|nr:NAD-binding protein [Methylococcales bacterium]